MKSWLRAFSDIVELFDEIEIWSMECEVADHPKVRWVRFKQLKHYRLGIKLFAFQVTQMFKTREQEFLKDAIVQVTGLLNFKTDINYLHFSYKIFRGIYMQKREAFNMSFVRRALMWQSDKRETKILNSTGKLARFWVVSRELGQDLVAQANDDVELSVVPNSYDDIRFSLVTKERYRAEYRRNYGFSESDKVLVFASLSHFERKGLFSGIDAVLKACEQGAPYKFLILGGTKKDIAKAKKSIKLHNYQDNIIFAGLVSDIEKHLSCADGLLFPSHFEAFSLSEIEAAAIGLRLYLTKHYGTEMIMREPRNGRFIPWDVEGMANCLVEDWKQDAWSKQQWDVGEALNPKKFSDHICLLYRKLIDE
jgi:glycosyltransferase involved in cell wall biosynthesis